MNSLARVRVYGSLIRVSHTVFALPFAVAAVCLAHADHRSVITPRAIALIVLAVASARTAAMAWNRLVDRDLDARNPRTAAREIPTGAVSPRAALTFAFVASLLFVAIAAALSRAAGLLAIPALIVILGYSLAKRFTWACHAWLGIALALAPGGAWIAAGASPNLQIATLMLAVASWVAGFDVLYALADESFDRAHGVRSIPARFGRARALAISRALHALCALALLATGAQLRRGVAYFAGATLVAALLAYEQSLVSRDDLSRLDRAFFDMNGYISVAFLATTILDEVLR